MNTHIKNSTVWVDNINTHTTPATAKTLARALIRATGSQRHPTHRWAKRWAWHTPTGHASFTIELDPAHTLPIVTLHDRYTYAPTARDLMHLVEKLEDHAHGRRR